MDPMILSGAVVGKALTISLFLLLPAITSWRVSGFLFGAAEQWRRLFAALCGYQLLVFFPILVLHFAGALTARPVLAMLGLLAGLSLLLPQQKRNAPAAVGNHADLPSTAPYSGRRLPALAFALLAGALSYHLITLFARGPEFFSDDFAYHGLTVASWAQAGQLTHPLINITSYYPYNPHLLALYFTLPTSDPQWVWLGSLYWLLLAAGAVLALGCAAGRHVLPLAAGAATVLVLSPTLVWMTAKFCSTDLAGAAALLAAFAVARPREGAARRELLAGAMLCGIMAGMAVGTKVTYTLPAMIAVGCAVHFGARAIGSLRASLPVLLSVAAGLFATGSFWYLRNLAVTGNPLFPMRLGPFSGPINGKKLRHSVMATFVSDRPLDSAVWQHIVTNLFNWPLWAGLVSAAGLLGTGLLLVRAFLRAGKTRSMASLDQSMLWLGAAGLLMLLVHPFTPFSGATLGSKQLEVFNRYVVFVFAAGLVTTSWLLSDYIRSPALRTTALAVSLAGVMVLWPRDSYGFAALAVSVVILFVVSVSARVWTGVTAGSRRPVLVGGLCCLALPAFWLRENIVPGPFLTIQKDAITSRFEPAIHAIDRLPAGSRIAQLTNRTWESWHLYGSRFQMEPVFVDTNGREIEPLHVLFREKRIANAGTFGIPDPEAFTKPETLIDNLRAARADYVLVTQFTFLTPGWPPQRDGLRESSMFRLMYADGFSELYARQEP